MKNYIETIFDCNIKKVVFSLPKEMPQYLISNYRYQKYVIENQECLFVEPLNFSFIAYKKQYQKIEQITKLRVVLQLKNITRYQRKKMIEERIPFVVENTQIYLPFLAIYLIEKNQEVIEIEKFTPITQLVFLYLFYKKEKISATDLSQRLRCTPMSVTRAYKVLIDCGLFHREKEGVKKYVVANFNDGELLRNSEKFFVNPIETRIYVSEMVLSQRVLSGICALSKKTMLNATADDLCYAVYRKEKIETLQITAKDSLAFENMIVIEKWSYDPSILADDDIVDDISLVLTLKDNKDERVQMEIDRLRSKYEW